MLKYLRIAAFTGGKNVPSARFRVRQYRSVLKRRGVDLEEFYSFFGSYPPDGSTLIRVPWAAASLTQRIPQLSKSHDFDITFLQRELLSTFMTLERFAKRPRILDVDDAIWLNRPGFAKKLAKACDAIVCGNTFLHEVFSKWNPRTYVIPTAVDPNRFHPNRNLDADDTTIIVWSGTSSGFEYLIGIESALKTVLQTQHRVKIRVISDKPPPFYHLPPKNVEYLPWTPDAEVRGLQSADIGIMPLADTLWSRGKCSYKMLTYMACGLPVVVTPVGMNKELLLTDDVGLSADTSRQWADGLIHLIRAPHAAVDLGRNGRQLVRRYYSVDKIGAELERIFRLFV